MSEPKLSPAFSDPPGGSGLGRFVRWTLPYIIVLTLTIFGVAYTNMSHQPLVGYWEFLAAAIGVVCVITAWPTADDKQSRFRLMWTQAAHWGTFLITMNIVLLPNVQRILPTQATSLVLLMLLALAAFLAGIHLFSLRMCFLGFAMALCVPAIAWLKQSALLLVLAAALLIGLGIAFWPRKGGAGSPGERIT